MAEMPPVLPQVPSDYSTAGNTEATRKMAMELLYGNGRQQQKMTHPLQILGNLAGDWQGIREMNDINRRDAGSREYDQGVIKDNISGAKPPGGGPFMGSAFPSSIPTGGGFPPPPPTGAPQAQMQSPNQASASPLGGAPPSIGASLPNYQNAPGSMNYTYGAPEGEPFANRWPPGLFGAAPQ